MNKYWHGLARNIIVFDVLIFSAVTSAEQIVVMSNTRKDLPRKIESTNIKNQNYVWQLELTPNQTHRYVQVKLMNPNPTLSMLNNRALSIARKMTLDQLPRVKNDFKNKDLNLDEQKIAQIQYFYGKYTLFITFPETVQYAVKPNFAQLQNLLEPFCQNSTEEAHQVKYDEQGNININAKFNVDTEGQIQSVNYTPNIHGKIKTILDPWLKKIRFYPRNEYGMPKSFSIEQPVIIQCQS